MLMFRGAVFIFDHAYDDPSKELSLNPQYNLSEDLLGTSCFLFFFCFDLLTQATDCSFGSYVWFKVQAFTSGPTWMFSLPL